MEYTEPPKRGTHLSFAALVIVIILAGSLACFCFTSQSQLNLLQEKYSNLESQYSTLLSEYTHIHTQISELQNQIEILSSQLPGTDGSAPPNQTGKTGLLTLPEIYSQLQDSTVLIINRVDYNGDLVPISQGSGFVYDMFGHIITNNHVVEDADALEVTFVDGAILPAELLGSDPYSDLAVIKVDSALHSLKPVTLGNSSKLVVGEQIVAIGNPFGLSNSMTTGIVSQLGRQLEAPERYSIIDVIQVDAAINPGNSGGPLVNMRGEVVGVNTAIISGTGTSAGVGFAVPSDTVAREVPSLITTGEYKHPWLGISAIDVNPDIAKVIGLEAVKGFLIVRVVEGSPADEAGLTGGSKTAVIEGAEIPIGGDVVIGIDDVNVRKLNDALVYMEREKHVDDKVVFTVIRDGETLEVELILGERPPPSS